MLTGLLGSSKGEASLFGKDLFNDMDEARKVMGVCPQHDVLFDLLTPAEHLDIFYEFKGADKTNKKKEIEQMLQYELKMNEVAEEANRKLEKERRRGEKTDRWIVVLTTDRLAVTPSHRFRTTYSPCCLFSLAAALACLHKCLLSLRKHLTRFISPLSLFRIRILCAPDPYFFYS